MNALGGYNPLQRPGRTLRPNGVLREQRYQPLRRLPAPLLAPPEGRRLPSRRGWWAVFWALNIERLQRALGVALLSAGRGLLGLDRPEGAR